MKSLMPWVCLVATASVQVAFANEGLDAYREGDYVNAAAKLAADAGKDPIVDYYLGRMRLYGYGQLKNNALALRHFKQAAEKGFLPAQNIMARYTLLVENNPEQALSWFKKAAEGNDVQAQMYCAAAYLFGIGTNKNSNLAKKYYIDAAKNGNSIAEYTLAEHFLQSRHGNDKKLGLIWLNKAVEKGNPQAQLKLGELYAEGKLVPKDLDKSSQLINQAIAQDYVDAIYEAGKIAEEQKDLNAAKDWYAKGAFKNYLPAQVALAQLYLRTDSPLYNPHTGYLWVLKAAQHDSAEAQHLLAKLYQEGKVIAKDEVLGKEWEQKALATEKAMQGPAALSAQAAQWLSNQKAVTFAQGGYQLGGIFSAWQNPEALKENNYNQSPKMDVVDRTALYRPNFVFTTPNEIVVSEYYDALAASLGNLDDVVNFPKYALNKNEFVIHSPPSVPNSPQLWEVAANPVESESFDVFTLLSKPAAPPSLSFFDRLYEQAILGNSSAQFLLAQMYEDGIDVKQNVQEAIKFYQLAAEQKDLRAEYNLGLLYLEGKGGMAPDYQRGMNWLQDAAFKGNAYAQFALGRINERGLRDASGKEVIAANADESTAMYYLAAANDFGTAQYRLAELLVREKPADVSMAAKARRNQLIKQLYEGAVAGGVQQAALPLAFFHAMDSDKAKQVQAFNVAKNEVSKGNGQAALLLGILYDRGLGVEKNSAEAMYWYQQASLNPVSAFILGTYFIEGKSVNQDKEKGRALLQQAADAGFPYADLNLAVLKQQQGEPFLPELDAAHALGNSKASLLLADYYLSQATDEQKMQQSREIYQQLAEKGDKEGQLKLGFMYEKGLGGPVDMAMAQQWYTAAANQEQPVAQYLLGHLYQLGWLGKLPDYVEAKKWYGLAQSNYSPAAVALGFIHETVEDDYEQAFIDYEMAALQNDPNGQFNLGLIYEKGKGRAVDFEKARELYASAAEKNHSQAMTQLAGLFFNGQGGPRDQEQALYWYKKAAALGEREALYQLGLLSETGVALKLDFPEALQYYEQAADKGNAKAMLALARMYQYGLGVEKNNQQAAKFYEKLAALNNPYAQYQLATFYYDGAAGERMPEKGKKLLLQAQENGSAQARKILQRLEAQGQVRLSYIEPVSLNSAPHLAGRPVELMYLDALNEWNLGDEQSSRIILDRIMMQFPHYVPAKRAYEQLNQTLNSPIFG
ncbi:MULTISPECIES: tetratricopeptide repeat protein [Legionella]|uniref:tetratricopeptide repeat protein n=1 Tax=Legionella TaxID=445 RepID=UPI000F8EF3DF|nr:MULTISPECIES: SEL1-like repeat protein [Legionella]MCP0914096.1 SEL1-like repeat protein [Legionella sp. 27cVA30]RUQ99950.1 endopeptidase IV [Legionella septentrionalis]RUR15782.1 endopeptidase IV [Legionella septentrionalis]